MHIYKIHIFFIDICNIIIKYDKLYHIYIYISNFSIKQL